MTGAEETVAVWEATFRSAYPSVYRALVAMLLDAELAQDALQEAFEQGLRTLATVPARTRCSKLFSR